MFHTHVAQSGDNTLAGGATEVTALAILAELGKQAEFSESIWIDATGTFFIRRVVYSENLETYTVEYTLADGSTYSPTAPIEPASAGTDRELVVTSYTVVTSGTGYTIGDIVQQINVFDVVSDTLQSTIWYNQTTDLTISPAPNIAHLQPEGSIQSIASATGTQADSAYTTGNGTIISVLKGIFGRLSKDPSAPASTQSTANFYVAAAVTQDQNSSATATTPSTGGRWIQAINNSGVICDITVGGTAGANDGTTLVTLIAGASVSLPIAIAASAVLRVKPRSTALTSSDVISVVVA